MTGVEVVCVPLQSLETLLPNVSPVSSRQTSKLIGFDGKHRKWSAGCRPDRFEAPKVFIKQQLDWL